MTPPVLVEACVDTVASALAAGAGGAGRVELCANLPEGGTTPSPGTIALARERLALPLFVLVRPRAGDFCYDADEVEAARRDVAFARAAGAHGVVLGALTADGRVDAEAVRRLTDAARPLAVTFHRAFDVARDPDEALDDLLALGVDRVLTSGGAPSAAEGAPRLAALVRRAAGRLTVLAGGGIRAEHVAALVAASGVREVHVRGAVVERGRAAYGRPGVAFRRPPPADEHAREVTSAKAIRRVVRACAAAGAGPTPGRSEPDAHGERGAARHGR